MFFFSRLSDEGLNFVSQVFDSDGKLKTYECLKDELFFNKQRKI